jgi:hypothetical protein
MKVLICLLLTSTVFGFMPTTIPRTLVKPLGVKGVDVGKGKVGTEYELPKLEKFGEPPVYTIPLEKICLADIPKVGG